MRKNNRYKLQLRSKRFNGNWTEWNNVKTKESAYIEEINLPKKSEISTWFREIYAPSESIKIDWQAGFYWGCFGDEGTCHEFRVIDVKTNDVLK